MILGLVHCKAQSDNNTPSALSGCSAYRTYNDCLAGISCTWNNGICVQGYNTNPYATATNGCANYRTQATCAGSGCYWNPATAMCSLPGAAGTGYATNTCQAYGSLTNCNAAPGCTWNAMQAMCTPNCAAYTASNCATAAGCMLNTSTGLCTQSLGGTASLCGNYYQATACASAGCLWNAATNMCTSNGTMGNADCSSYTNFIVCWFNVLKGCHWDGNMSMCRAQ